ncbi:hypothetical protein BN946_scf184791.g15 [Trametes cinnabarina]|uniref:Aminotransferase class I/classII large domain-containing protein n=1 Tax=Pycnoporus cinnabarinus TaxID=5643 RepID=A0A060S510_PYCCI|nr:hypothetical protein BN946_scf184791.g15 [Trametes cinnabarina]
MVISYEVVGARPTYLIQARVYTDSASGWQYEGLVFDGWSTSDSRRSSACGSPVGSAGKLFSATGWRVGWLIGPPALIDPALATSTRIVSCANTPMREWAPVALEQARERRFFETQLEEYAERRAVLVDAFEKLGMEYAWTEGSYFVLLMSVAAWFIANHIGVSCIPVSKFYCDEHMHIGANYVNFSFCKDVDMYRTAAERLQKARWFLA